MQTAEPVPTAVIEKAYGISSPTANRGADLGLGLGGIGSPKANRTAELEASLRGPIMPPSSPLSASVYDKKLESVEKVRKGGMSTHLSRGFEDPVLDLAHIGPGLM